MRENVIFLFHFWQACYRGNIKAVRAFLIHPEKQKIFSQSDYDGTGN